jgi:hypothetical protein
MSSEGNGFFGSLTDSLSNLGSSVTEGVSSLKDKFKTNGINGNAAAITTPVDNTSMGGKKKRTKRRKSKRRMRGGYSDNISRTGVASTASPISDIKTPTPRFVGGRRSRRRSNRKSRKSRK